MLELYFTLKERYRGYDCKKCSSFKREHSTASENMNALPKTQDENECIHINRQLKKEILMLKKVLHEARNY